LNRHIANFQGGLLIARRKGGSGGVFVDGQGFERPEGALWRKPDIRQAARQRQVETVTRTRRVAGPERVAAWRRAKSDREREENNNGRGGGKRRERCSAQQPADKKRRSHRRNL